MANKIPDSVRGQLDSMLQLGAAGALSDGQLLDRVDDSEGERAEAAFAVLVERHGPMVLRVCRDAIGNTHDAEDACQAVFLVLARKAGSVRGRESAAAWLFGVARKVSSRARRDEARRREHERREAELATRRLLDATRPESWEELYEEIDRLPESYRAAVVLCHFEGLTHEEAAGRLGCPLRTLQSRLLRARARLRDRLARRGIAPGAGAFALLEPGVSTSPLPAKFAGATVRLALSGPSGVVPAAVASLGGWSACHVDLVQAETGVGRLDGRWRSGWSCLGGRIGAGGAARSSPAPGRRHSRRASGQGPRPRREGGPGPGHGPRGRRRRGRTPGPRGRGRGISFLRR